jgi:anti-anti-sigma factor
MSHPIVSPNEAFRLEGALDIYAADGLRQTLQACLASAGTITLDLGGVESCDTTGVQLLLAARATAAERRQTVQFRDVPEAVAACCRRLGLPVLA